MSSPTPCVPCCSEPVVTNIPGTAGATGPQGEQGEPGADATLDVLATYGSGTPPHLTATSAMPTLPTTAPSVTLTDAGTYILFAHARFDFNAAVLAAVQTITIKIQRSNNTPAAVANTTKAVKLPIVNTVSYTAALMDIAPVEYTASAGDVLQIWADISVIPSSGFVDCVEADIVAIQIA